MLLTLRFIISLLAYSVDSQGQRWICEQ
jgi:hypothetical protein